MMKALQRPISRCCRLQLTLTRALSTSSLRVETAPAQALSDIPLFRQKAFTPEKPFHFKGHGSSEIQSLPAAAKWFTDPDTKRAPEPRMLSSYLDEYLDCPFPYELYMPKFEGRTDVRAAAGFRDWLQQSQDFTDQMLAGILQPPLESETVEGEDSGSGSFNQFYAPLKLLKKALEFNQIQIERGSEVLMLYIAQSALTDLPPELQPDLPAPQIVREAGKGDIYNSSIWLGTEPTYTPLHRDPNPNLFYQLCNSKVVRLLPPDVGQRVFFEAKVQTKQQAVTQGTIRSTEMMEGAEREILHGAIWANEKLENRLHEAEMDEGDALFIPKGWWHSVKSVGLRGHLNGSVNWWFR